MAKTSGKQPKKQKHLPLRTCIACRETKPKRELLRVVRTPDGHIFVDATGKKSGRGAYISARLSCWQKALKEQRIEHELEATLSEEDRAGILAFMATLPADEQPQATQVRSTTSTETTKARITRTS
jgi:Predicted nucleic-acid-binding protein implicated in transcription termination